MSVTRSKSKLLDSVEINVDEEDEFVDETGFVQYAQKERLFLESQSKESDIRGGNMESQVDKEDTGGSDFNNDDNKDNESVSNDDNLEKRGIMTIIELWKREKEERLEKEKEKEERKREKEETRRKEKEEERKEKEEERKEKEEKKRKKEEERKEKEERRREKEEIRRKEKEEKEKKRQREREEDRREMDERFRKLGNLLDNMWEKDETCNEEMSSEPDRIYNKELEEDQQNILETNTTAQEEVNNGENEPNTTTIKEIFSDVQVNITSCEEIFVESEESESEDVEIIEQALEKVESTSNMQMEENRVEKIQEINNEENSEEVNVEFPDIEKMKEVQLNNAVNSENTRQLTMHATDLLLAETKLLNLNDNDLSTPCSVTTDVNEQLLHQYNKMEEGNVKQKMIESIEDKLILVKSSVVGDRILIQFVVKNDMNHHVKLKMWHNLKNRLLDDDAALFLRRRWIKAYKRKKKKIVKFEEKKRRNKGEEKQRRKKRKKKNRREERSKKKRRMKRGRTRKKLDNRKNRRRLKKKRIKRRMGEMRTGKRKKKKERGEKGEKV